MASISLINKIKGSSFLYNIYYYSGSFLLNVLKHFIRCDNKLFLFVSYGGKKYDDTPKDIFLSMIRDKRFKDYDIVWAFDEPNKYDINNCRKIKIDTFKYFITALKARVWITNVSVTRGLSFRGKHTFSLNSWHGTAIKKIGADAINEFTFRSKDSGKLADVMLAQSNYDVEIYSRAFKLPKENVLVTGFPRNDTLVSGNTNYNIQMLKQKMGLPLDKKVILYAPTFREYNRESGYNIVMNPPLDLKKWHDLFGQDYILIIRAHIAVAKLMGVEENDFIRNFSTYPELNNLLLVTDILISDYSGILFDFSILERPIICYAYDYQKYNKVRGLYIDIRKELITANNEMELIECVKDANNIEMKETVLRFKHKFVEKCGCSAEHVLDVIYEAILS